MPAVFAQEVQREAVENPDAILIPSDFTKIVKDAREFLKTETESFLNGTAKKTEFETTQDFEKRVATMRQRYLDNVVKYSTDKKFDKREFGVIFKANLVSYDADSKTYAITSNTTVEIPYDIPYLQIGMTNNALVALTDSVARGYRSKTMYLKMTPPLHYEVPMDLAKAAKDAQGDLMFRVALTVDMIQANFKNLAQMTIAAHHIQLLNPKKNIVYWESNL
jgi:hypothetical protein